MFFGMHNILLNKFILAEGMNLTMKKVFTLCLTLIMVMTMSITAFAAPGAFVESPSGNAAPQLISFSNLNANCTADLTVTSYADRNSLSESDRQKFENAYSTIANTEDLSNLNSGLSKIASDLNVSTSALAVSDLFNVSYSDCDTHDEHGAFTIKLKAETLKNFAALMRYDGSKWVIVEGAKVSADGLYLTFSSEELGPFAIVVNTASSSVVTDSPQTGDSFPWIYIVAIAVSAIGLVVVAVIFVKSKKKA